jgi:hypothetical protein
MSNSLQRPALTRRRVVKATAWTVPAVIVSSAAPAYAAASGYGATPPSITLTAFTLDVEAGGYSSVGNLRAHVEIQVVNTESLSASELMVTLELPTDLIQETGGTVQGPSWSRGSLDKGTAAWTIPFVYASAIPAGTTSLVLDATLPLAAAVTGQVTSFATVLHSGAAQATGQATTGSAPDPDSPVISFRQFNATTSPFQDSSGAWHRALYYFVGVTNDSRQPDATLQGVEVRVAIPESAVDLVWWIGSGGNGWRVTGDVTDLSKGLVTGTLVYDNPLPPGGTTNRLVVHVLVQKTPTGPSPRTRQQATHRSIRSVQTRRSTSRRRERARQRGNPRTSGATTGAPRRRRRSS